MEERIVLNGCEYVLSPEMSKYATLRAKYAGSANKARETFAKDFSANFQNLDELVSKWGSSLEAVISGVVEDALRNIVELGIYDIGERQFREQYYSRYNTHQSDFSDIAQKYSEIVSLVQEGATQRQAESSGAAGVIGGGFGLEGAARGIAIATAANVALGAIRGLGSMVSAAADSMKSNTAKDRLFSSTSMRSYLAEIVYNHVYLAHFAIMDVIDERLQGASPFKKPSFSDVQRAASLLENLQKGRIIPAQGSTVLTTALFADPFNEEIYIAWLEAFGDSTLELDRFHLVHQLGGLSTKKQEMLFAKLNTCDQSTSKACEVAIVQLRPYAQYLGLTESESCLEDVRLRGVVLENATRTFNGLVYKTVDEASEAKELASRTVDGVLFTSADEAQEALAEQRRINNPWVSGPGRVGYLLAISIFIAPIPNALLIFRRGYSKDARIICSAWFLAYFIGRMFDTHSVTVFAYDIFSLTIGGGVVWFIRAALERHISKRPEKPPRSQSEQGAA